MRYAISGLFLGLAACGPDAPVETTPAPANNDALVFDAGPQVTSGVGFEGLLNAARAEAGLPALSPSAQLTAAAQVHADDMAAKGFFSHEGSDNSQPSARVRAQGYGFCFVAENIAKGQPNAEAVMASWMSSPGHRANNLSDEVSEFGLAQAPGALWVLVLARPGC